MKNEMKNQKNKPNYFDFGYVVREGRRYKDGKVYDPIEESEKYKCIAMEAEDKIDKIMVSMGIRKEALGYKYYYLKTKEEVLRQEYGIEWCSMIKTYIHNGVRCDAVENTSEYKAIENELEKKIELELCGKQRGMGFCHVYWSTKKRILKQDYNIDWCSPAELNESIMFD